MPRKGELDYFEVFTTYAHYFESIVFAFNGTFCCRFFLKNSPFRSKFKDKISWKTKDSLNDF